MKAQIKIDGNFIKDLPIELTLYSKTARIQRALKLFLILLLAAVLSILIPVLHFILFPGFLVAAFIMGYLKFQEFSKIDLKEFKCPSCNEDLKMLEQSLRKDSIRIFCFSCKKNIEITPLLKED